MITNISQLMHQLSIDWVSDGHRNNRKLIASNYGQFVRKGFDYITTPYHFYKQIPEDLPIVSSYSMKAFIKYDIKGDGELRKMFLLEVNEPSSDFCVAQLTEFGIEIAQKNIVPVNLSIETFFKCEFFNSFDNKYREIK
ncbi:hypothetical protein [Methylocucumis oryzae]|nr:hypothetical protein [Methylocucumis oryzae]